MFQGQVVSRRQGEFEKLLREREERLAEMRLSRHLDCERRRKMEYYRQQEEARLLKIKEEEEARKREGTLHVFNLLGEKLQILQSDKIFSCTKGPSC